MKTNWWNLGLTMTGVWVLAAFIAGCVHIATTFDHPDLGRYVLAGTVGLAAFAGLLLARFHNGSRRRNFPSDADAVF